MEPPLLSVILFDGECSLCSYSAQFILRRDPNKRFHFAALQSPSAQNLLRQAGQEPSLLPDSVILVEPGQVTTKSTAALRIARHLSGLWPFAAVFLLVPAFLRDGVYDFVARHRYRLFGRTNACMLPTAETRGRFLSE